MKKRYQAALAEYPRPFWVLMGGVFIDQLGANFIYPFFALFVTARFGVGLAQVGLMLGTMTAGGIAGSFIGGSLADRYGRKVMILFGLLVSGLFSTAIIFITRFEHLFLAAALVGLLGSMSDPARQAMIADLLPEERRASGFGLLRVVFNLTVAIGPLIGGFASDYSFNWLFIGDALTSAITFVILLKFLPETKPAVIQKENEGDKPTVKGYISILRDRDYLLLLVVIMLSYAVLMQMMSTLSVFMRDVHDFPNRYYGYILSLNAGMVVALQFWVSRRAEKLPPMLAMVVGSIFATIGYSLFGFVQGLWMFGLAMVIVTCGEMILDPMSQTLASQFAPADMRGRYMAAFGFSVSFSNLITPYLAGLMIDTYDPNWIWYACGIIGLLTILGYWGLHIRIQNRKANLAV